MDKSGRTPKKKKKDGCMSIHERKWTGTKKKKKKEEDVCMSVHEQKWMDQKKKKKKMVACPSMNKSGRTPKKLKKKNLKTR